MSVERVKSHFKALGLDDIVIETAQSSGTVQEAALAIGTQECRIAKTLSFLQGETAVLVVVAGDAKVDNRKYKDAFNQKASMIKFDQAEELTGHAPGGICPFGVNEGVLIYLDESLRRFDSVYPAAGSSNSHVHLTIEELEKYCPTQGWVDVTKVPEEDV
ncbi:MAG: YbaK/EbsC family protein [Clostridiaceae bacterium]